MSRAAADAPVTAWPLSVQSQDVIVVGGAFDPPHAAHVRVPDAARSALLPRAWLVFVPAARSPLKGESKTSDHHRVAMLRLAVEGIPRSAVWTDEVDRAQADPTQPSFSIDTLERAREIAPHARLKLLMGADQAVQFHRWRRYREVLALAPPMVVLRPPFSTEEELLGALLTTGAWTAREIEVWRTWIAWRELVQISSTHVRERIQAGDMASVRHALDPRVEQYIVHHGLYRP